MEEKARPMKGGFKGTPAERKDMQGPKVRAVEKRGVG